MKRLSLITSCLMAVFVLAEFTASAQILVDAGGQARLVTEPSGNRDDNNGGNTVSGALIGTNAGSVDNFLVFDFSDLSAAAGQTVTGATIDFQVATGFSAGNHGSVDDVINLSEIALPNLGWVRGSGEITGADNQADDGSVSFLNRIQFDTSGTSEQWLDASGTGVGNLLGALTTVDSVPGYNVGGGTPILSFSVDAATAQGWVDNGLGGLALSVTDNGDLNGRFNFIGNGSAASNAGSITFLTAVPEPSSGIVLIAMGAMVCVRRKRG